MNKINLIEKKIMITGGAGFLGSHVVDLLMEKGCKKENIFIPRSKDYNLINIVDVQKLFEDFNADIVIHIAADIGGIGYSKENPGKQLYNNIMMNTLVQDQAYKNDTEKFVGIGTVCSYPKFTPTPFKEDDLWNGYPEETNAAYGISKKVMMEQSIAYKRQYGFNGVHLLMINLYGPRDNFNLETSHVIPAFIRKILMAKENNENKIIAWGDGSPTREFIHVRDAARAIVLATESYNETNPVNIGSGEEISIKDLFNLVAKLMEFKGDIIWDNSKSNGQPKRKLDVSKAKMDFNFEAEIDFEEGLKETINWYLRNRSE